MAKRRWECPLCGKGALGPQKPRKDATVRYCLGCSEKTGRLVERVCPALDKVRKRKAERRDPVVRARRRREAARERFKERPVVAGVDVKGEVLKIVEWAREGLSRRLGDHRWNVKIPEVKVRRSRKGRGCWSGISKYNGGGIVLTFGDVDEVTVKVGVVHEVAHQLCPDWAAHGPLWRDVYVAIAEEVYGAFPEPEGRSLHALDCAFQKSLMARVGA